MGGRGPARRVHPATSLVVASKVELLLCAREALSAIAPRPTGGVEFRRSLHELTAVFARHVDVQEATLLPTDAERVHVATFDRIMEDVSIASFHVAASARLKALRAGPRAPSRVTQV